MQFIMAPGRLKLIVGVVAYRHSCKCMHCTEP